MIGSSMSTAWWSGVMYGMGEDLTDWLANWWGWRACDGRSETVATLTSRLTTYWLASNATDSLIASYLVWHTCCIDPSWPDKASTAAHQLASPITVWYTCWLPAHLSPLDDPPTLLIIAPSQYNWLSCSFSTYSSSSYSCCFNQPR